MVELAAAVVRAKSPKVTEEDFVHVGPDTLCGQYLRRFWHPVYVGADLPVGLPKPIRILGEDFTLYRGASGDPHVVGFRCAHRGNQLSLGWVEGDAIRCYYHGWRYDATGQCDRQPHEEHAFCQKIRIPSYPVQEYLGLIFLYLGPKPAPPLPRYPLMEREAGIVEADVKIIPYNYFQSIENNVDSGHVPFVHRRFHRTPYVENADDIPPTYVRVSEKPWGIENASWRGDSPESVSHFIMPNIHLHRLAASRGSTTGEEREHYSWRTPIDDEQSLWFNSRAEPAGDYHPDPRVEPQDLITYARRVLAGEERIHDIDNVAWVTNIQDLVSQYGQGAIADRRNDHLGKGDAGVILLRQIYKRELTALAEGKPLTEWAWAPEALSSRAF